MFRNVPECSGMFHVPGFIDARFYGIMAHKKFKSDHASKHYSECASMFISVSLVTNLVCYRRL